MKGYLFLTCLSSLTCIMSIVAQKSTPSRHSILIESMPGKLSLMKTYSLYKYYISACLELLLHVKDGIENPNSTCATL